jgi:hypothetical protein
MFQLTTVFEAIEGTDVNNRTTYTYQSMKRKLCIYEYVNGDRRVEKIKDIDMFTAIEFGLIKFKYMKPTEHTTFLFTISPAEVGSFTYDTNLVEVRSLLKEVDWEAFHKMYLNVMKDIFSSPALNSFLGKEYEGDQCDECGFATAYCDCCEKCGVSNLHCECEEEETSN